MGWITCVLLMARAKHPELAGLHPTFGASATKEPPPVQLLHELRLEVAKVFGLRAAAAEEHHWASPMATPTRKRSPEMVGRPRRSDLRVVIVGGPMGVTQPIAHGNGACSLQAAPASMSPEEVLRQRVVPNHARFEDPVGFASPPGYDVVTVHVNSGFGMLFSDRRAAEEYLQSPW